MSGGGLGEEAGGPAASPLEPRVAKLEASVEHIERDTADIKAEMRTMRANARGDSRLLFDAIISVALGSPPSWPKALTGSERLRIV